MFGNIHLLTLIYVPAPSKCCIKKKTLRFCFVSGGTLCAICSCPWMRKKRPVIYWSWWIEKPLFPSPKSTAWLSLNNWLFISFHCTQRPNPETTWATNVDCGQDHHWKCHPFSPHTKTHWLQLLWSENAKEKENASEVAAVIFFKIK